MGQKINPRSLRHSLWDQSHWAYYTHPQNSSVAWTQSLKNVMTLNTSLSVMKRFRALKAPSRQRRKKPSLWHLHHWLRWLPYSQWYHSYSYKWGSYAWQNQLSPIKMRYRAKARNRHRGNHRDRTRRSSKDGFIYHLYLGKMTEWLNVPVWKTGFFKGNVGSNPSLSVYICDPFVLLFFDFLCLSAG